MPYHDELNSTLDIPTLKQMTEQAISFLEKKESKLKQKILHQVEQCVTSTQ